MPGMPEKRTHDYLRHGTTNPFAPFNTADGTVISGIHRRHRAIECKKFLTKIDTEFPDGLEVHLVRDGYSTHKSPTILKWLETHPRFHMHFSPTYSSCISQVDRFFAYVTAGLLQRSDHRQSKHSKPPSANGSRDGTRTPNHSSGPNMPNRSSNPSNDFCTELKAKDTTVLDRGLFGHEIVGIKLRRGWPHLSRKGEERADQQYRGNSEAYRCKQRSPPRKKCPGETDENGDEQRIH